MKLEAGMRCAGQYLKLGIVLPGFFASLLFAAVLLAPGDALAAKTAKKTLQPALTCTPKPTETADFNGACTSDILWQNSTTGELYIWFTNGATVTGSASPGSAPSPAWTIQGVGDFNGDGIADILWRNNTTGEVYIWLMGANGVPQNSGSPASPTTDWSIRGVGDFDGDGKADILWLNNTTGEVFIWFMNGTGIDHAASPGTAPSSDWGIQGVGDFDGDGHADILWQDNVTGEVYVWLSNATGTAPKAAQSLGNVTSDWSIQGIGDFNGDGKSDILWRDSCQSGAPTNCTTNGLVYIWFMNGTSLDHAASPGSTTPDGDIVCTFDNCTSVGDGWRIAAVGDFNGDGVSDILWHNDTGQTYVWLMNATGTGILGTSGSLGSPTYDWEVASLAPYNCSTAALCNILAATNNVRANGSGETPPWGPATGTPNAAPSPALFSFVWDVSAARIAAGWAAGCVWPHNPVNPFGENVYDTGTPANGTDQVTGWAAEAAGYTLPNTCNSAASPSGECGHWTQLVWRNTRAVGCAIHTCASFTSNNGNPPPGGPGDFVVCDYSPAGNFNQGPTTPPY
jgi:hypothetical protein